MSDEKGWNVKGWHMPEAEPIIGKDGDLKGFYMYIPDEFVDEEYKEWIVWKWLLYIIRHEGNDE